MANIRESINEMIEESYLLGLTENEIKEDLDNFVEICGKVIHENVHGRKQMQKLTEKLARARALSLIEDHGESTLPDGEDRFPIEETAVQSSKERFAEKVARNKRLILRTIRECDPKLEQLIEQERYPGQSTEYISQSLPIDQPPFKSRAKDLFLKTCYVVTLLFILLLVYLVLLQNI